MPIALTAKIVFDPQALLQSRWVHDTAHEFVKARFKANMLLEKKNAISVRSR